MFDIGFSEMVIIAVVTLLVVGPERLPTVARTVGALLGRVRRYANDVKAEVHRELQLDDVRKMQEQLAEQARQLERNVNAEATKAADTLNDGIKTGADEIKRALPPTS